MPRTELGSLLISRGLVTPELLERALERQQSFGGRIGTCLLEIGALSEGDLLEALGAQLEVPAASRADLVDIPAELLEQLSKSTAVGCSAVPFRELGGRTDVALIDAGDLALEDELSFSMGKRIRPHVANELRIVEALSRYYDGDVPLRFRSLLDRFEDDAPAGPSKEEATAYSPVPAYLRPGAEPRAARKPTFSPPSFDRQAIPLTPAERSALEASRQPEPRRSIPVAPGESSEHELFGIRLSEAETASQIGACLVEALAERFPRVLVFRATSGQQEVSGWLGHGDDLNQEWFRHYSVGLHHATVFRDLAEGESLFVGKLDPTPAHKALARCWNGTLEQECLVLPVSVRGKLVCAAYCDRVTEKLQSIDTHFLEKLAKLTSLAFERCILRRKLQAS